MSSKRNRLSRSSSQGEVATMMPPFDSWQKKRPATNSRINANVVNKPVNVNVPRQKSGQQPVMINKWNYSAVAAAAMVHEPDQKYGKSSSIWTLMYEEEEEEEEEDRNDDQNRVDGVDESFGAFYQACALCRKKLPLTVNIFMYGYLQAFCSIECRDAKIAGDDDRFKTPSPQRSTASTSSKPGNSSASRAAANGYGSKGKRTEIARFK